MDADNIGPSDILSNDSPLFVLIAKPIDVLKGTDKHRQIIE